MLRLAKLAASSLLAASLLASQPAPARAGQHIALAQRGQVALLCLHRCDLEDFLAGLASGQRKLAMNWMQHRIRLGMCQLVRTRRALHYSGPLAPASSALFRLQLPGDSQPWWACWWDWTIVERP